MAEGLDMKDGEEQLPGGSNSTSGVIKSASDNPNCIFCQICSKEKEAEILYEDSDFVCFPDRTPVSTRHYLVVPRQHIVGAGELSSSDIPLVQRMAGIGKQVLAEKGGNAEEARMGFHWPPLVTIKHLHLHIISPEREMNWLNRKLVFRKNSYFFSSPEYLLNFIKNKPS